MKPIAAQFLVIKVEEDVWDIAIFSEKTVLKAFEKIYDGFYVEKSVFDKRPMCVIPEFPNLLHAEAWKKYWITAFENPNKSCKSCVTVNELFRYIEIARKRVSDTPEALF